LGVGFGGAIVGGAPPRKIPRVFPRAILSSRFPPPPQGPAPCLGGEGPRSPEPLVVGKKGGPGGGGAAHRPLSAPWNKQFHGLVLTKKNPGPGGGHGKMGPPRARFFPPSVGGKKKKNPCRFFFFLVFCIPLGQNFRIWKVPATSICFPGGGAAGIVGGQAALILTAPPLRGPGNFFPSPPFPILPPPRGGGLPPDPRNHRGKKIPITWPNPSRFSPWFPPPPMNRLGNRL